MKPTASPIPIFGTSLFRIALLLLAALGAHAAEIPEPKEGRVVLRDFRFRSGEVMPALRMHYRTFGAPARDTNGVVRNAVLLLHGTTGSGTQFLREEFAGELFGPGQPLDITRHYVIVPDNIGHGQSSKPSDGLRAKFPRYGYHDMIEAQRRLLVEGLDVTHLRLVIGMSLGGMHVWMWGQLHPDFMDALMPLGSLPTQVSGRNRVWRRVIIDSIRHSPDWNEGNYTTPPAGLRPAAMMLFLMSNNPVQRQRAAPTLARADAVLDAYVANVMASADANDILYAVEACHDYDPGPELHRIKAPLVAINTADDLINPPELGILEREIRKVPRGRAILMPMTEDTRGHGTHTIPALWKHHLETLMRETEKRE